MFNVRNSFWGSLKEAYGRGLFNGLPGMTGNLYFVDYVNGSDTSDGRSLTGAVKTLSAALALCTAGNNDVVVVVGNGATTGTCRLDAALTWNKNATHLVGICAPSLFSQRARIAPTATTTAFANFFTVSADGCYIENLQFYHGFNTDTTNQIAVTVSGNRNVFRNVHFGGVTKGDDTGARSLKVTGQENFFEDCVVGIDTVDRSVANASLEFASGAARNVFRNCLFPFRATNAGVLGIKVAAAAGSDRFQTFDNCLFQNHNTTMTALCTLAASMGGFLHFHNPGLVKITGFGSDATSRGQIYVSGAETAAASSGLAVAPTA